MTSAEEEEELGGKASEVRGEVSWRRRSIDRLSSSFLPVQELYPFARYRYP